MGTKPMHGESSKSVVSCQICGCSKLESALFLGYLPPVNQMEKVGERRSETVFYPAELLYCTKCGLAQLGTVVSPEILFPKEYPYTSSTTKILRENFAELYKECSSLLTLKKEDLVIDIGSNDGNLLSNFQNKHRVLGVTPEDIGKIAIERGIPTILSYFTADTAKTILGEHVKAKVITATNVFAHIDHVHEVVENVVGLLDDNGVFISESHYLIPLLETLQYDTIYHEHLRYYHLSALEYLLREHHLEVFHAKRIPTHGGSIRVYAARKGKFPIYESVKDILSQEKKFGLDGQCYERFRKNVVDSKLQLLDLLQKIRLSGEHVIGISAPSRASTLVNYVGIDEGILDCVVEVKGSHEIGKYMPGTHIPILPESELYSRQPEYALLLSWHIADELIPKLKAQGFRGKFIVPLAKPRIVEI